MSLDDFGTMLACLMKVCWASIAGQLHLATDKDTSTLRAGLCSKVDKVSPKVRSLKCCHCMYCYYGNMCTCYCDNISPW